MFSAGFLFGLFFIQREHPHWVMALPHACACPQLPQDWLRPLLHMDLSFFLCLVLLPPTLNMCSESRPQETSLCKFHCVHVSGKPSNRKYYEEWSEEAAPNWNFGASSLDTCWQ